MTARFALVALAVVLCGCPRPSAQDVGEIADRFAERERFHGVVLVARSDSLLHAGAYGLADVEAGRPTRLDTRYQIGSLAKWVATVVVLDLAEDGLLDLDAPVSTYLPSARSDAAGRVSLRHLLANRSGIPNDLIAAYEADPTVLDAPLATTEAVERFASGELQFEPGTAFDYSHSNWIVVQAVVEAVAGEPFDEVLRQRVTGPLRLDDTAAFWDGGPDGGAAPGYEALAPEPERVDSPAPRYLVVTGGMVSTAPDLLVLVDAVYGGRLLSAASLEALDAVTTPERDLSAGRAVGGYALGGRVRAMDVGGTGRRVLWHTGSNGPWKARVSRVLGDGLTVITLTNTDVDHEATGTVVEDVLEALP